MGLSKAAMTTTDAVTAAVSIIFTFMRIWIHIQRGDYQWPEKLGTFSLIFATCLVIPQVILSRIDDYKTEKKGREPLEEGRFPYQFESGPQVVSFQPWRRLAINLELLRNVSLRKALTTRAQNHYISYLLQIITLWVLKGSYLTTFWGMTDGYSKAFKRGLYFSTIYVLLSFIAAMLIGLKWCHPIWRNWYVYSCSRPQWKGYVDSNPGRAPGYGPGTDNCDIFSIPPLTGIFAMNASADIVSE